MNNNHLLCVNMTSFEDSFCCDCTFSWVLENFCHINVRTRDNKEQYGVRELTPRR